VSMPVVSFSCKRDLCPCWCVKKDNLSMERRSTSLISSIVALCASKSEGPFKDVFDFIELYRCNYEYGTS
jgi:hypothetical protein